MKRKLITIPRIILFLLLTFISLHLSPRLSLRTHLFITGRPKIALNSEINELNTSNKKYKLYTFNPSPKDKATGNDMNAYKVTKILFLYVTTHHGGG